MQGSLPAWGVWIEIEPDYAAIAAEASRSPHGECGLKYQSRCGGYGAYGSLPAWGVWIEISGMMENAFSVSSLPAWGVWIEIANSWGSNEEIVVAPRMGSVD